MKKNKKKYVILLLLFVAVGMGIGYSLLQQQLKIQGTATVDQKYSMEIIGIDKLFSGDKSHYDLKYSISNAVGSGGLEDKFLPTSTESYSGNKAVFDIKFKATDTIVLYRVKIKNTGNYNSKISNVSINKTGNESVVVKELTDINNLVMEPSGEAFYIFSIELPESSAINSDTSSTEITITVDTEQYVSSSNDVFMQKPYIYFDGSAASADGDESVGIRLFALSGADCKLMVGVNGETAVNNTTLVNDEGTRTGIQIYDGATESYLWNAGDQVDMYAVCTKTSNISAKEISAESNHIQINIY